MLETNYQRGCDTLYARWERVDKAGHELVPRNVEFTIDFWPNELNRYYGDGPGYALEFFLRIRPSQHTDHAMQHGGDMK